MTWKNDWDERRGGTMEYEKARTELYACEMDFFRAAFCKDRDRLLDRMTRDFVEYGKSGCSFGRDEVVEALSAMTHDRRIEILDFQVVPLDGCWWQARYRSVHLDGGGEALRSSLWKWEDGGWRMAFHQGTPVPTSE